MPAALKPSSVSPTLARVAPMQVKCGTPTTPSSRIACTTCSVPICVEPPAP